MSADIIAMPPRMLRRARRAQVMPPALAKGLRIADALSLLYLCAEDVAAVSVGEAPPNAIDEHELEIYAARFDDVLRLLRQSLAKTP